MTGSAALFYYQCTTCVSRTALPKWRCSILQADALSARGPHVAKAGPCHIHDSVCSVCM